MQTPKSTLFHPPTTPQLLNFRPTETRPRRICRCVGVLAASLVVLGSGRVQAVDGTWTATGSNSSNNGNWSDTTKWSLGTVADGASATATFPGLQAANFTRTITLEANRTIGVISCNSGGTTRVYQFNSSGGSVLTLSHTTPLSLTGGAGPRIRSTTGNTPVRINVPVAGTGGMGSPDQAGIAIFLQSCSYTGTTVIYRGILQIGNTNVLPSGSRTGDVYLTMGGNPGDFAKLDLREFNTTINGLNSATNAANSLPMVTSFSTTAGTTTLTLGDNNANGKFDGVIANGTTRTLALTKIGAGEQILTSISTYTGPTTISNGRLTGVTGGACASSDVSVGGSGTLNVQYLGSDTKWTANSLNFSATGGALAFDFGSSQPSATTAPLELASGVIFAATPTVTISGPTIANGTYPLIKYSTSIAVPGNMPLVANLPGGGTGILQDNPGTQTIDLVVGPGATSSPIIHWATGSGVWDTSANNWKGENGITNYVDNAPVQFTDTDSGTSPITVTLGTTVQPLWAAVNSSKNYSLTGTQSISGTALLSKSGTGSLTLDLTNTHTGGTTLCEGTLNVRNPSALGNISGTLTFLGGTIDNTTGGSMTLDAYPQAWNGNFSFVGSSDLNLGSGSVTLASTRTVTVNAGTLTAGGGISGSGGLTIAGAGTLTLAGSGTYSGDTRIATGTLVVSNSSALAGSALDLNAADNGSISFGPLTTVTLGSLKGSRSLVLENASSAGVELRIGNNNSSSDSYSGLLSGAGRLTKIGTGIWQFGVGGQTAATYAGDTTIAKGTIKVNASSVIPHGVGKGNLIFDNDGSGAYGALDFFDRTGFIINGLSGGGGTITKSSSGTCILQVGENGTGGDFAGVIQNGSGTVGFTKLGAGTQILSGVNTYSGATTVSQGTLLVNSPGSLAGTAVTVASGAILGGNGTINGSVAVSSGGTISPGTSPGTLTLNNGLNLSLGGKYVWELGANSTANPGTDFDQIVLGGGTLILGGSSVISLQFVGTATTPNRFDPFWQVPHSWLVISASGAALNFGSVENGSSAAGTFSTSVQPSGIVLTFTPPPLLIISLAGAGTASVTVNYTNTLPGTNYTLQYNTNLSTANWYNVGTAPAAGLSAFQTDNPPVGETNRFYRVRTP